MRRLLFLASFLGLFCLISALAFAHGGQFNGNGGSGSGSSGGGAGGATGGGGGTPGGGGTTGGGNGGGATGGGGGPTGGGAPPPRPGGTGAPAGGAGGFGGRGGATPGAQKKPASSDEGLTWDAWWFYNDDKYLQLKAKIRASEAETDNTDIFVSEGSAADVIQRVPVKKIQKEIIPVLKFGLKDSFYDTRAAASIALAKCGSPDVMQDIFQTITDDNDQVQESACLAMGILGNKEAIPHLIEIMKNSDMAKKALKLDGKDIRVRTRAFAALGIGLIGARFDISDTKAVEMLTHEMNRKDTKYQDELVTPIVALGLMKSKASVPMLREFLGNAENDYLARSYVCTTLGKIGDRSAIPDLLKATKDKHNQVNQSAVIALGVLADPNNDDVAKRLKDIVQTHADQGTKNFAIIALGEIGGSENRNYLVKLLKEKNRNTTTFASIALGVYSHKNEDPEEAQIAEGLLKIFREEKNHEERGACAVALGLMKYTQAGPELLSVLDAGGQASLRGNLCIGLGLMGYTLATDEVRDVVKEKGDVQLRRSAAIALGLLGDKSAVDVLKQQIEESSNSIAVHGAVTQGLGFIGDINAVPTLTGMVQNSDKKYQDATRAFAAVALGLLGDKDDVPIIFQIAENNNYLVRTDALAEALTIL